MSFLLFLLAGFVGLFLHWFKKWSRGEIAIGFIAYMITEKKHSIASVVALFSAIVTMYVGGDIELTKQSLALAFMAGYSIDSAINKSGGEA